MKLSFDLTIMSLDLVISARNFDLAPVPFLLCVSPRSL